MPAAISPLAQSIRALVVVTFTPTTITFTATGFVGTVTWSVNGVTGGNSTVGTISPSTGTSVTFTASNITAVRTIRAVGATSGDVSTTVTVTGVFPSIPHFPDEMKGTMNVLMSEAADTTRVTRIKSGYRRKFKLQMKFRNSTEFATFETFYQNHNGQQYFIYDDAARSTAKNYWFDSDIQSAANSSVDFDYAVDVCERL